MTSDILSIKKKWRGDLAETIGKASSKYGLELFTLIENKIT